MVASRSFGQLLKDSLGLLRSDPAVYLGLVGMAAAVPLALALLVPASRSREALDAAFEADRFGVILAVSVGGILARLIESFAGVGAILAAHERSSGGQPTLSGTVCAAARAYGRYFRTGLRALVRILGGLLLLIVPGLILALRYMLLPYTVLLEGLSGREALERSASLCKRAPGQIYGNLLGAALVIVLCGIFAGAAVGVFLPPIAEQIAAKALDGAAHAWLAAFSVLLYRDVVKAVE